MSNHSSGTGQPYIRVDNLTKVFPSSTTQRLFKRKNDTSGFVAVNDVSFEVKRGQVFVIMGLSGSGKSTIIRMMNRLIDPTSGSVVVNGEEVSTLSAGNLRAFRNNTMNMVFQNFGLFPHKTLLENASFGLKIRGLSKQAREEKAIEALELVGLGDRIHALPDQLSGGMRQRVGLARALATDAEILLMDEPFSALDPLIRKSMQDLLIKLQQNFHKTIIFVTHDLNEAMRLGDRIMVMKQGAAVQLGTALDLLNSPADAYIEEFVADVDRSKVLTAAMVIEARKGAGDPAVAEAGTASVTDTTILADMLPLFASGAEVVRVHTEDGRGIGEVTVHDVLALLSPENTARGLDLISSATGGF